MENKEILPKSTGTCRFCGQSKIIQTVGGITQGKADELATNECTCSDAKIWQNRQKKIDKAKEWAKLRFEKTPNIITLFNIAFEQVVNHDVEKISVKQGDWTHNIFLDSDGYLNVKSSRKVEEEVDFA